MAKIKHIALSTQDVEAAAKFYVETFGMKEVGKVDDPGTRGVFLTDGDINLEQALGVGPGTAGNVEVKWTGPDGVMLDVSKAGWLGTPTFGH